MRDPGAVEAVARLALLVLAHLRERDLVRLGILAGRDVGRHPADRVRPSLVTRGHEELAVGAHERDGHRHLHAVGQHPVARPELLDRAEDVVPAAGVQRAAPVAQLVEDLLHLERREDGLDQDGAADRAVRQVELLLGEGERIGPEARLEMRLELGEVEVRPAAALELLARVPRHVQAEVEERGRDRLAVDESVPLGQVPAARPDQERRDLLVEAVRLVRRLERDLAAHGVGHVPLPLDDVLPLRRARVLVVGHEHAGAGVERVDHHLAVDRAGDLAAAVAEIGRSLGHPPLGVDERPPSRAGRPAARPRRARAAARAAVRAARGAADSARDAGARRGRGPPA